MWAITPRGIGKPVGARRVRADWPLADGEAFIAADWHDGLVLAEDGGSLREGTAEELAPRRLVDKAVIVDRLIEANKLAEARAALDAQPLDVREKWNARDAIYADDESALALLQAIGADPAVILAPTTEPSGV